MARSEAFGHLPDGDPTRLLMLENDRLLAGITVLGGRLAAVQTPDRAGVRGHVVLGFDDCEGFAHGGGGFGALLGPLANRVAGGRYTLDGTTYDLPRNDRGNTLHSGPAGFDKAVWQVVEHTAHRLVLRHTQPAGLAGFPGPVEATATYRLEGDTLWQDWEAVAGAPCCLNLSAHPYFNLAGPGSADIYEHELELAATQFLPTDDKQIPTGERRAVEGTPFDFRAPHRIGERIREPDPQLAIAAGYDHCYVLDSRPGNVQRAARLRDPASGRTLELLTDHAGLQVYSGNNLTGAVAGRGGLYRQGAGLALEAQDFPDAPNQPGFPTTVLRPGETYRRTTGYRFSVS